MTRTFKSFTSSDLSRTPKLVFDAASVEPVLITRRDGDNLILMSYRDFEQENDYRDLVGSFLNALDESNGLIIGKRLAKEMPWLRIFNEALLNDFVLEMIEQITVATSTGVYRDALTKFDSWQAKARAIQMGLAED